MPPSIDQESNNESAGSRHSSVHGPYRQAMKETQTASFPFCNHIKSPEGEGKSYSRSLLSAGYGFPLRDLTGDQNTINRPAVHIKSGLCIGDVIAIDSGATFTYFFNVFKSASDPAQSRYLPPSFEPFGTSLEDMQINTRTLSPGTVVSSPGVDVTRISSSPLELKLSTSAREAAFMILPEGASREDLFDTSILHSYVKRHAVEWYRYIRMESGYEMANGTLYLITGCDRPTSGCCTWASVPARHFRSMVVQNQQADIRYKYEGNNNSTVTGQNDSNIEVSSRPFEPNVAIFIRGMRIALCSTSWPQHSEVTDAQREYYRLLSTPVLGRHAKLLQLRDRYVRPSTNSEIEGIESEFHPSNVICSVLIQMKPASRLAIVEDSSWMSAVHGEPGTLSELTEMILRVFSQNKIVTKDGIALLIPKTSEDLEETSSSKGLSCLPFGKHDEEEAKIRSLVRDILRNHT